MVDAARTLGCDVRLSSRVTSLTREGDRITGFVVNGEQWSAGLTIVAAGSWTAKLCSTGERDSVSTPTRACCPEVLLTRRTMPSSQLLPPSGCSASSAPTRSQSPFTCGTIAPKPPVLTFSTIQLSALLFSKSSEPPPPSTPTTPS